MILDFIAILEDSKTMKIYDNSVIDESVPQTIWSYTLEIRGSRLPNGGLSQTLDIIAYLKSQRIQDEIYTITSGLLGLPQNEDIPDGVYHFDYHINNTIIVHKVLLVYQKAVREVEQLLINTNYKINVTSNEMKYLEDEVDVKYDIEKVRYAKTLLDRLEFLAIAPDEIEVNDTLDKLERLLGILK